MENYKSIYCRAKSIMDREEDVLALMNEVYELAAEAKVAEEHAEAWMIKQTYILGCGKYRKKKAREAELIELQDQEYEAHTGIDCDKTKEIICETLAELPDLYHATLFAFYYDQYSLKEVAAVTGYSEGVVINRLNYAHKYLSKKLEDYQEEHKVKVQFSVEMVYEALKQWAAENTLDEEEQPAVKGNVEVVEEELRARSVKKGLDKKQVVMLAAIIGGLAVLALIAMLIIGNQDKKEESKDNQVTTEDQADEEESENQNVPDNAEPKDEDLEEDNQEVSDSEYILPNSNSVKLTRADLQGLSKEELRLARNEIFARYGVIFGAADLNAYFGEKSWYQPTITLDEFNENNEMNSYEEANLSLIVEVEEEME